MIVGKKLRKYTRTVLRTKRPSPPAPETSPQAKLYLALVAQREEADCPVICEALEVLVTAAADAYDDLLYYAYQRQLGGTR